MPAALPLKAMSVLLVLVAPLPYWALGLPWCSGTHPKRIALAPLVGCALAGFYSELALIAGISVRVTVALLTLASAALAWMRTRDARADLADTARDWILVYLLSVIASALSPFPVLGNWAGDWYHLYDMGLHVMNGALPAEMLARPPLFGAATVPLWLLAPGLIPYQMMSAVAAASAVLAMLYFVDCFWPKLPRWPLLLPLLMSPFFLNNTAAAWGKLLAGGLILAALAEAGQRREWASGALFALSVAVHEASIIWAPCLLAAYAPRWGGWRGVMRVVAAMAVTGLAINGPLLLWILVKYGLAAKVATSPALTYRNQEPFAVKTLLVVVSTLVGWGPVENLARWLRNPQRFSRAVVAKESFWLVSSWFTTMAGTLVGLLFPFALCWRRLKDDQTLRQLLRPSVVVATGLAIVANAGLCGYYSSEGSLQTGMAALGLAAYGLCAGAVVAANPRGGRSLRQMSRLMAVLGTFPWAATNVLFCLGLWLSAAFRARIQAGTENDYVVVVTEHLSTLGMSAFPEVPAVAGLLLLGLIWYRRRGGTLVPDSQPDGR